MFSLFTLYGITLVLVLLYEVIPQKADSNIATTVNYGVASFSSWSKAICNLVACFVRIRGASCMSLPLLKENTLNGCGQAGNLYISSKGKPQLGSHTIRCKYPVHPDTLVSSGDSYVVMCTRVQVQRCHIHAPNVLCYEWEHIECHCLTNFILSKKSLDIKICSS